MRVYDLTKEVNATQDVSYTNHPIKSKETADFLRRTGHPVKSPSSRIELLPFEHEAYVEAIRKHYLQLPF